MAASLASLPGRLRVVVLAILAALHAASPGTALAQEANLARDPERASLDRAADEIEGLVQDARFRTAIGVAESATAWAAELEPSPELREARSRLWVLLATAQLALGEEGAARASMDRALDDRISLTLPERTTSPRVLGLLAQARSARAAEAERAP